MKSRKGKRIAVFCSMIVLLILIIIGLTAYFIRKRDKIEIENSQFPWEADTLFDATGKGNAAPEDSYLILDRETGILPHVFPGDSYVLVESKGRVTRFINEKDGETYVKAKPEYKYLDAVLYDLATGEEVRRIDLLEVIRDACPGFQYGYSDDLTLGKNGHKYLALLLEDIPEKATDETVNKMLFYDIDTGDTYTKDSEEEWRDFLWAGYEKEDEEYGKTLEQADWEWDELLKKDEYGEPAVRVVKEGRGCAEVILFCSDLPKENDILYNRFPNLKKYIGREEKMAYIYIGGYPTADEIKAMFCENADSGGSM